MVADSGGVVGIGGGGEPEASDSLRTFGAMVQALREHAGLGREELADDGRVLQARDSSPG